MCIYVYTVTNVLQKATEDCQSFICRFELLTQRAGGHVPGHQAEEAPSSAPSPLRLPCASEVTSLGPLVFRANVWTAAFVANRKGMRTCVSNGSKFRRPFAQMLLDETLSVETRDAVLCKSAHPAVQPPDMIFTEFGTCFACQLRVNFSTGVFLLCNYRRSGCGDRQEKSHGHFA